ncbi:PREDICTED: golgin subfamily B member 1-like [Nipponia nippon]|uniref:golgin subfamily B member 1-like n=1 Tax=Nipponia nippon TaxID=128390 RepID=UPI0005118F83|nr:PREDICTED: golgin subfamily B member 1-like [Nipponia nippon]
MSVADLAEQLTSTEQLVTQLKELVREKDAELRNKDLQLKEEKESADAKLSKLKLQNKAKVASLTSQLEELKKQLSVSGGLEAKAEQKKASKDGDQENAAANRGKILVLRRRIEELESQITQKNEELQNKSVELEAQRCRGDEMDAMLAEKEKKLAERDAYIIDLQIACGSSGVANETLLPNEELKNQLAVKESSLQSMQILVQNLTKKVGDSEEKCSLLQEQIESLKNIQNKERERFQGKEATYMENVRVFQNIIQEKEKELEAQREKHEQELFKLAAKADASADLEQLLKALKQKLHEKEEVMLGRTQVIDVLQKELDAKDQQLKEINENVKRLQSEKENLQSKLDAEKHVMRAQLRDMMEKHELEMTKVKEKYNAELHEIQEKHETELQEKDQALFQLKKQVAELSGSGQTNSKEVRDLESITKEKMEDLEVQVKLKMEEFSSKNNDVSALNNRVSELEIENEELQSKLQSLYEIRTQNEELLTKLEVYEEQQRKLQADLDQVTKRAASQASESGSVDELQSQLLEWQENVPESEESHDQVREEKSAMALRMAQIEEEREAMVSGQQELEEELTTVQGMGRLQQARRKSNQTSRKLQEEYNFDRKQCFQELNVTLDSTDSAEGENMGGLRSVVEELELERNQLQEQILFLEERCQDLEDRLQLQGRMEALQNENERLQTQLTQLRNQQMRDGEKHQILISGLNEQLKGLSDRNSFLETSLGEKEQKLLSTTEKLEQLETLRKLLQEKDLLNRELGEKFVHTEQKLNEALKKCSVYEVENTEQKTVIGDLTEKVATLKEKTLKQDGVVESMRLDLDQTNEELDKLNTSHLEERSQLIQDLQKREREIDNLKEALAEKDREMSVLSLNMTEYSEQVIILKHQVQCKEEEIRGMEEALSKAERETHLLKEVQTADVRDASVKISVLSEQSNTMRLELERVRVENEAKTKENEELIRQSSENSITIKDLRSEIKANNVAYHNKLAECESQITLLKEQISKSSEKLQETEDKQRKETEYLKSQLEENNTLKEKWNNLLKEKESKAQTLENELKSIKDSYNKLVLENAKKDEELAELSRQLMERTEHQETIKKELQEKQEFITSLEQKLGVLEQQNEETKLKLTGDLKAKETCCKELNNQLNEIHKQINKMEIETREKASANKQLQADLEGKEEKLLRNVTEKSSQLNDSIIQKDESLKQKLDEYISLKAQLSEVQESSVLQQKQLELLVSEAEQLKVLVSEKELTINNISLSSENLKTQLQEKENECEVLKKQVVELEEAKVNLQKEIQHQKNVIIEMDQSLSEKESSLTENKSLLETLKEKARKDEEKTNLISQLKSQVDELTQELQKSKELVHEREDAFLSLQEKIEAQYELRTELNAALEKKEVVIAGLLNSLKEKDTSMQLADSNVNVLSSEIEVLREKLEKSGTAMKNLTEEFQEKNEKLDINQKKIDSLTIELDSLKNEHQKALDQISTWEEQLQQKELAVESLRVKCTEQADNIACLKLELNNVNSKSSQDCRDNALLIASLQCQVESLEKQKNQLQEDADKLMAENAQLTTSQNHLQKELEELREINEKLETSENYSRMQIDAVKLQMKSEKEKLQMQVSVKGEELSKLELKLETLEQSLLESENKWVTELDRATLQNNHLTEQLSSLESEMKSKDSKIQSLQQELDLMKEELTQSLSPLLSSRLLCKEKAAQSSDSELQLTDSKIQLEKFSTLITAILSKETEGEQLQLVLLEKQKEIDTMKDELKSMQSLEKQKELLQNDIEKMKGKYESEIECLSEEMVTIKETLCKQQSLLQEREESFAEINKQVDFLQDKINKLEEIVRTSQEKLHVKGKKVASLLEEMGKKDQLIENLTSQVNQQKDLISGLSQQLKEKDCSVTQIMESLSNEMLNFSEERNALNTKLQDLEAAHNSSVGELNRVLQELEDCKKELEHSQVTLSSREAVFKDLVNEKEEMQFNLEKMEKDAKISDLTEILSAKASYLEKLQDNIAELNDAIAEKQNICEQNLKSLEEKDCKLAHMQSMLDEKASAYEEERSQLLLALEKMKSEVKKKEELLKNSSSEEPGLSAGDGKKCLDPNNDINIMNQLKKEKEALQRELLAVLGEAAADLRNLESDKPRGKVQVASLKESENMIASVASKDAELKELRSNYAKLQEETEMFKKELRKISVEFGDGREETVNLNSLRQQEQHQEQCKGSLLEDIKQLQKKLKGYEAEAIDIKTVLEHVNKEKEALLKKSEEDYKMSEEKLQRLRLEAKKEVAEKNEEIEGLRCSLMDFKDKLDQEKELLNKAIKEGQEEAHHYKTAFEGMKSEKEKLLSCVEKSNLELINMKKEAEMSRPVVSCKELKEENDTEKELGEFCSEHNLLQGTLQGKGTRFQLSETDYSRRTKLREATECQSQKQMQMVEEPLAKTANVNDSKPQEPRTIAEENSRERLQRKLQAALISRKEALRENKCLKDQIDKLMLEREELVNKTGMLEHLLELGRGEQSSSTVSPLSEEESLVSENARLLTENKNLTAACESLKSTMETIVQEKEAFSFQLNTLKDSQTVELTGWKAKHSELKQEYESLLQAYENISSKIADMRQVIDLSRKEKQEAIQRLREGESEKEALEKHLQKLIDENEVIKNQLKQLGESKKMEVDELQSKAERQICEQEARMQEHQDRLRELTEQNHQLMEENEQLKQTSENLKQALEKIQNENDILHNNITVTKAALGELQVQMEVYQNDMQSKINDALCENESLLKDINVLKDKLSEKEHDLDTECKSLTQEIVSLNEKVKILEDDKCLLQEELENVQESSYKVKNEREFLETELLNHVKKVDHLTDRVKSAQVQNALLLQQLEELQAEKSNVIREKEEQQLHLVKMFEEKVKSAQRDNNGSKTKTKELQELLKEKQQEINHLQKDSIKFQELILDLERSVKLSQSKSEKFEKDLSNMSEKLVKSHEEICHLKGELSSQMNLLDQSKNEVDRLTDENLNWRKELKKKEDELQIQKREYKRELEFNLQQLKLAHKREFVNLEERHSALEREKDRAISEIRGLQEEVGIKDSQNKKLQADLNAALARLAAFTKCMSSLQDDRDRVITEMKTWELQFKEAIQNKEKQIEDSNKRIMSLQDELKDKITQIQELNIKYSAVEETKDELYLRQKSVDVQRYEELCRIKEENTVFFNRQQELESVLQSKEEALQALLKENNSLNHLIENSKSAGREIKALESNFTRQEQELQQLLAEKEKINAELQKQITISEQMKVMLNNKDKEISLLISSKGDEISDYLIQVQTQHRKQIKDYELQLKSLQIERQQSKESCQRMENELKSLQMKADKAGQDKAAIASEIDAFKKSMSSLQNDRDDLFSKYKELEHLHQDVLHQRDSLIVGNASENNALKQELRILLNQIDDLHSENAMLSAQLIKYREDLNQVLSLKDHQLKDLLKQKLDCIKSLEQEKYDLQKQIKEMQLSNELQKDTAVSLEHENKKLVSKVSDLESLIASLNKEKLVSESGEKLLTSDSVQKKEFVSNGQYGENLQKKMQELQKSRGRNTKDADEEYTEALSTLERGDEPDAFAEKMVLEVQSQNSELRSQNEAFGKAMTALQNDRDRIIEDFKVLQSKYTSELRTEKKKGDELEAELGGFKLHLISMLKENSLLNRAGFDAANKVTLDQIADEIENLCRTLVSREMEVSRLSSECGSYVHQIEAFSKAMASLQDDRDKLLQELSNQKVTSETKQGTASFPISCNSINETNSFKSNLDTPQNNRGRLAKEGASLAAVEISKLKTKVDDLEKALHQTKAFQAETEREIASYQNELAGLRMENNLLLSESQALRNQCQITVAEKDRQIAELQKLQQDMIVKKSVSAGSNYPVKVNK